MHLSIPIAERLLAAVYSTCSHDLPNQILSLQSLINLLEMDEAARLDGPGREYLQRLKAVADKTAALSNFLKESVRLARHAVKPSGVDLGDLFRELQAEARSILTTPLRWEFHLDAATVRTDRDLVYPSVGDLVRVLAESNAQPKTISVSSNGGSSGGSSVGSSGDEPRGVRVELGITSPGLDKITVGLEKRCDVILARERLAVAGVRMALAPARCDAVRILLEFPAE